MNNLGVIYSTVKNAEKHIIIDSENVELSGNVKLTNGNLDVSQNLKFNNFSVTDKISFRENSGSTSYNIINNSLTANNDASFNNVDISGNVDIKNELQLSGNPGSSGQILQSGGSGSVPSWTSVVNALQYNINSSDNDMKIIDNTYALTPNDQFVKGLHITGSGNNADFKVGVKKIGATESWGQVVSNRMLEVAGSSLSMGGGDGIYFWVTAGNHMRLNNEIINTGVSDDRIKFNETLVSNGLDVINKVNIYKYDKVYEIGHTPDKNPFKKEVGVIAQEIQKIPELAQAVSVNEVPAQFKDKFPNGTPMSVYYDQIHSYHIKATQELHSIVKSLDTLVQNKENRINNLEAENTLLKSKLNELLSEAGKPTI